MFGKDKDTLSKNARQKVKERTDDLLDDDDFDMDIEINEDKLLGNASTSQSNTTSRRRLEDYLEERRLKRELSDDFDY